MEPQTTIRSLEEILSDLNNDGNFLSAEIWEIRNQSKAVYEKTSDILNEVTF